MSKHASTRDVQRSQATTDLFAAFAEQVIEKHGDEMEDYDVEPIVGRFTLWALADITDPQTNDVLQAIFAERRRRLSAATREGRREA